jgi:hypothetical protein
MIFMDALSRSVYEFSQQRRAALAAGLPFDFRDHRPGYRVSSSPDIVDARRKAREARDAYVRQLGDAWRSPGHPGGTVETPRRPTSIADANAMRRSSYLDYVARLGDAWQTPSRDAQQPDLGSRPGDLGFHRVSAAEFISAREGRPLNTGPDYDPAARMARHLRTEPDDKAEAMRKAAHQAYVDRLSSAWKQPTGQLYPTGADPSWRNRTGEGDPRRASEIEAQRQRWHGGR